MPQSDTYTAPVRNYKGKWILVAEDDIDDQEVIRDIINIIAQDLSVVFASNGGQVIEELRKRKSSSLPSLLILDYNMPEMSGAAILGALREERAFENMPKLIWSTADSDVFRKECLDGGALEYLIKPSSMEELRASILYMLSMGKWE